MPECAATLIWVHRSMRPQPGVFAQHAKYPELRGVNFETLTEAVRAAVMLHNQQLEPDRLPWIHAWGAGGSAIFDVVEIEAIRRTIKHYDPTFPGDP